MPYSLDPEQQGNASWILCPINARNDSPPSSPRLHVYAVYLLEQRSSVTPPPSLYTFCESGCVALISSFEVRAHLLPLLCKTSSEQKVHCGPHLAIQTTPCLSPRICRRCASCHTPATVKDSTVSAPHSSITRGTTHAFAAVAAGRRCSVAADSAGGAVSTVGTGNSTSGDERQLLDAVANAYLSECRSINQIVK